MNYLQELKKGAKKHKTILCFGLDPDLQKFPKQINGSSRQKITKFYSSIIDTAPKGSFSALKPNYAYFAQYGFEGLQVLRELIQAYGKKYTIILDAKRGDIKKTSAAYAREIFEFYNAGATTLSPLMGKDSIEPYFPYLQKGKGAYLLCRTSNEGANDFLAQKMKNGSPLYEKIIEKCAQWKKDGSLGLVAGATSGKDLSSILKKIKSTKAPLPLLIPGVGSQGGSAKEVVQQLKEHPKLLPIARINSSSSIAYAYKKSGKGDYMQASHEAMDELNKSLKIY